MGLYKSGHIDMKKMVRKLKKLISKRSASKVTSIQTINDLYKKIQQLEARNEMILQNNLRLKKQAKKYKRLAIKLLEIQYKQYKNK